MATERELNDPQWLAENWHFTASIIENRLCEGQVGTDPTPLMREVYGKMLQTDTLKAAAFYKRWFKPND